MTVVTVILRVLSTQYGLLIGSVRGGTYNLLDPASWPPVNAHKIEGTEAHAHPSRAIRATPHQQTRIIGNFSTQYAVTVLIT